MRKGKRPKIKKATFQMYNSATGETFGSRDTLQEALKAIKGWDGFEVWKESDDPLKPREITVWDCHGDMLLKKGRRVRE